MAILKKGSKGRDVEDLQKALNKLKIKPQLTVDGIFGPATEKAVKLFQKKAGLKTDGLVGPQTMGAIKAGGSLPEMTVEDYSHRMKRFNQARSYNKMLQVSYAKIQKAIANLEDTVRNQIPQAEKFHNANIVHWEEIYKLGLQILSKQKQFEIIRAKDPAKAKKLVKECEALEKQLKSIHSSKVMPNWKKWNALQDGARKNIDQANTQINAEFKAQQDFYDAQDRSVR